MDTRPVQWQLSQTGNIRKCGLRVIQSGWLACFWMFSWLWPGILLDFCPRSAFCLHVLSPPFNSFDCMILSLYRWGHRYFGGPKVYESTPYQLKACVSGGLLYAAVHTLPSLILKYDLPCFDCETEEWYERMNLHSINVSLKQHMIVFTELFCCNYAPA